MTRSGARGLTRSVVVRVDADLYEAIEKDAIENERTISQTIRHKLRELMLEAARKS